MCIRGEKERVSYSLYIAVYKHPMPSTEVKVHNLTHKLTTNIWNNSRALVLARMVVVYLNIVCNDKILWVVIHLY